MPEFITSNHGIGPFLALKVRNDCLEHTELTDGQRAMGLCCRADLSGFCGHFDIYFLAVKA